MKLNNSSIGIIHKNRTFVKMQLIAKLFWMLHLFFLIFYNAEWKKKNTYNNCSTEEAENAVGVNV